MQNCASADLRQSVTLYVILKPFQLVRVFLLAHTFIHLTTKFGRLRQRILEVVMVWVFTGRVL